MGPILAQWNLLSGGGGWFNIEMLSYQYRKSHCGDKTILRPSYIHNGTSYTGKTTSLYWISPRVSIETTPRQFEYALGIYVNLPLADMSDKFRYGARMPSLYNTQRKWNPPCALLQCCRHSNLITMGRFWAALSTQFSRQLRIVKWFYIIHQSSRDTSDK